MALVVWPEVAQIEGDLPQLQVAVAFAAAECACCMLLLLLLLLLRPIIRLDTDIEAWNSADLLLLRSRLTKRIYIVIMLHSALILWPSEMPAARSEGAPATCGRNPFVSRNHFNSIYKFNFPPFGPLQLHHSGFFAGAKWQPWKWNLLMLLLSVASIAVVSVAAAAVAAAAAAGVAFILALLN